MKQRMRVDMVDGHPQRHGTAVDLRQTDRVVVRGDGAWLFRREQQCKDIPAEPILRFIGTLEGRWANWYFDDDHDVTRAMPPLAHKRLALAKMRMLMRSGLVDGCSCGCRGDFVLTAKGRARIAGPHEREFEVWPYGRVLVDELPGWVGRITYSGASVTYERVLTPAATPTAPPARPPEP